VSSTSQTLLAEKWRFTTVQAYDTAVYNSASVRYQGTTRRSGVGWCKTNSQPFTQTWPPVWEVDAQLHNLVQRLDLELDGKLVHERQRHLACRDVRLDGFVRRQNVAAVPARMILIDDNKCTSGRNRLCFHISAPETASHHTAYVNIPSGPDGALQQQGHRSAEVLLRTQSADQMGEEPQPAVARDMRVGVHKDLRWGQGKPLMIYLLVLKVEEYLQLEVGRHLNRGMFCFLQTRCLLVELRSHEVGRHLIRDILTYSYLHYFDPSRRLGKVIQHNKLTHNGNDNRIPTKYQPIPPRIGASFGNIAIATSTHQNRKTK
jgi:hypothetical protein